MLLEASSPAVAAGSPQPVLLSLQVPSGGPAAPDLCLRV